MPRIPDAHPQIHNLPALLSTFIGRKREMAEIRQLLRGERLVTLVGPGGCGKSRLALQVAEQAIPFFIDGTWLVELASLADASLVPHAIGSVLEVREQPGRPLVEALVGSLRARQILLVLDNCEHLVVACARLAESLLEACPSLSILATSREALGVAGEAVWVVPPLSMSDMPEGEQPSGAVASPARQRPSEAVQLFLARAEAASPGFTLTADAAIQVEEICRRLDGMPLAIELAAARLRALSVEKVAELLTDRFRLLSEGGRTAPARQRTLKATLDWSYALLSAPERHVLKTISVFSGGCTLEAAEVVCAGDDLPAPEVLNRLTHLVDKSLVVVDKVAGEVRFRMLDTIREYALRSLIESGMEAEVRNRHLEYFVRWAETTASLLRVQESLHWINRFSRDHDNLRSALEWSQRAPGRLQTGLRLAGACGAFWELRHHSEGRMHLEAVLGHPDAQRPTATRATALHQLAVLSFLQSDYAAARRLDREATDIWRTTGDSGRRGIAQALELLAEVESETGNYPAAFPLYEEALASFRQIEDLRGEGDTLKMMGWSAMRVGDFDQAGVSLGEALAVCRRSGDLRHVASALAALGELAIRSDDYKRAEAHLKEALEIAKSMGDRWTIPIVLGSLGWLAMKQRHYRQMADWLRESLSMRLENGDQGGMAWCLEKLAQAALRVRHPDRAVTLLGAASALRSPFHSVVDPVDRPEYDRIVSTIRTVLGEQAFEAGWRTGERLPIEDAIEYGLRGMELTRAEASRIDKEQYGGVTPRELEVAILIARGRSNRAIAEAMSVGVRTVETYVSRVLGKLGLDSRVQIATWVIDKGLDT
ncbi:MAG TPA: tetratricopeptide repeat protein [Anaerolineales bacterium]|nr:tetratricopeptide repeat protein [Anaerolineales bacterium]